MTNNNYILGAHNSLTYLRPKKWWMVPFHWMARCQGVDYKEQYEKYGVRLFDLRIWFSDDTREIIVCHGVMTFSISEKCIEEFLSYLNEKGDVSLRVILEEDNISKKSNFAEANECLFKTLCEEWESKYKGINFFGGNRKYDWVVIYNFKGREIELDDKYSSTTSLFNSDKKWLAVIDDLFPWLYAKLNNKRNLEKGTDKECLFIDFVEIR